MRGDGVKTVLVIHFGRRGCRFTFCTYHKIFPRKALDTAEKTGYSEIYGENLLG
jgi:hypothetical protein